MNRTWIWTWAYILLATITCAVSRGKEESLHPDSESFKKSGYDYLWMVIQNESDELAPESPSDKQQHFELIDMTIRASSHYGSRIKSQRDSLRAMYPELLEIDDTPPLYVQYRYHSSQPSWEGQDQDFRWHGERLLEIAYQMDETGYPDYLSAVAWLRAASYLEEAGAEEDRSTVILAREHGIDLLVKAAALRGVEPRFHEYLALRIANHGSIYTTLPRDDKLELNARLIADQDADPWIGQFSTGSLERTLAWEARGSDYAANVTERQWRGFERHLVKAHRHLTKAWKIHPAWPEAATELITVTMGHQMRNDRDINFWFEQAINARIDDYSAYVDFAYALTPKWQGSMEHLYGLMGFIIAQSEEHDNMGRALVGVMSTASNQIEEPLAILTDERLLTHATRLMLHEVEHGPEYHHNPWRYKNLRALALGHFENGDYRQASELLSMGGGMVEKGWTTWPESRRFRQYLPLLASQASDEVITGLEALDSDDVTKAHKAYLQALEVLKEDLKNINPEFDGDPIHEIERLIQITE